MPKLDKRERFRETSIRYPVWCEDVLKSEAKRKKWPIAQMIREVLVEWATVKKANDGIQ